MSDSIFQADKQALPYIASLEAYTPGEQPGDTGWVKLNTNENPYPPSPKVLEAIREKLGSDAGGLRLYPDPLSRGLRQEAARYFGLDANQVLAGNGADDILNLVVRAFAGQGRLAAMTFPSYSLYSVLTAIQGAEMKEISFGRDMTLSPELIAKSGADVFFLTSPNAPTGIGFTRNEVERVLQHYKGLLVLDETYAPFAAEDAVGLLANYPHLLIARSFSKAYSLAGLRIGLALGHPEVIGVLDKVRESYNLDALAQVAGIAALQDRVYYEGTISRIKETRERSQERLKAVGWFTYPSQTNFLFTEPATAGGETGPEVASSLFDYLKKARILVRYFPRHALTRTFLRISVGSEEEMDKLFTTIELWLKNA